MEVDQFLERSRSIEWARSFVVLESRELETMDKLHRSRDVVERGRTALPRSEPSLAPGRSLPRRGPRADLVELFLDHEREIEQRLQRLDLGVR